MSMTTVKEDLGDTKFEEKREEKLTEHYDAIIGIGYYVQTAHGEGEVIGYEVLPRDDEPYLTDIKPRPSLSYRYMIRLLPGHTWEANQPVYCAFDNEVHMLLGQF